MIICKDLNEVRENIDRIDAEMVSMVEGVYRTMISSFINLELEEHGK